LIPNLESKSIIICIICTWLCSPNAKWNVLVKNGYDVIHCLWLVDIECFQQRVKLVGTHIARNAWSQVDGYGLRIRSITPLNDRILKNAVARIIVFSRFMPPPPWRSNLSLKINRSKIKKIKKLNKKLLTVRRIDRS
jgi:hypothetical protein